MPLVKFFVNLAVFNEKMFITKSWWWLPSLIVVIHKQVANGFIGNTVVTLRWTLTTCIYVLVYVLFNNNDSCMPCDINFRSQDHFKKLGPAVEIMSVHTDLHSHKIQSRISTKFPGHCLQSELWFKYYVKRVSCWQKWNINIGAISWDCICFQYYLETFHMRHIMRDAPSVKLHSKIYNPLGFNASWHNPHHCEKYIVMTALQCIIISRC